MLDMLFLSKMSQKGKIMYYVGQAVLLGLGAFILYGVLDIDGETAVIYLVVGAILILVVWGLLCIRLWPKQDKESALPEQQATGASQPYQPRDPFGPNPGLKK